MTDNDSALLSPSGARRALLPAGAGFWSIAIAFAALMSFTTVPTPLYAIYQGQYGFPTAIITLIFASYAFGVMLGLYLAGHLSDQVGRRPVVLVSAAVVLVSAVLFLTWHGVAGLLVARFVSGLGIGAITPTATAWIADLRHVHRPGKPALAATVGGVANMGGLAFGPLIGGMFAEWAVSPLVTPFVTYLFVIVVAGILAFVTPQNPPAQVRTPWRPQKVSAPEGHRAAYLAACFGAFAAFAITGFYGSVAPTILSTVMHESGRLFAGVTAFAVFAASAVAQVLFSRATLRTQLVTGTTAMVLGLLGIAAGSLLPSVWLFALGGIVAGAGSGLLFRCSLATAGSLAAPERRASVLTGVFLFGYAGMSVPPLAVGILLIWLPIVPTTMGFSLVVLLVALWAGLVTVRRYRH